jgi:muramidase (phage lysozyme)
MIPEYAKMLLDFIGNIEAPKGYDTIYGNNQRYLKKPVTSMTVDEIIASSLAWSRAYGSSATGRYQFMNATLKDLKKELKLTGREVFTPEFQDRLGYHLLKRRGYEKYVGGNMTLNQFGLNLAKEWASLPVLTDTKGQKRAVKRGQSFYAGDGKNASLVTPQRVEAILNKKDLVPTLPEDTPEVPRMPPSKPTTPYVHPLVRFIKWLFSK